MGLIETEEAAKRLARVILSDIELYNRHKIQARQDLSPELDEGYAFFRKRVAPALVPLFSQIVADRRLGRAPSAAFAATAVRPPAHRDPIDPGEPAPIRRALGAPAIGPFPSAAPSSGAALFSSADPTERANPHVIIVEDATGSSQASTIPTTEIAAPFERPADTGAAFAPLPPAPVARVSKAQILAVAVTIAATAGVIVYCVLGAT
jgi:hypothetical protein